MKKLLSALTALTLTFGAVPMLSASVSAENVTESAVSENQSESYEYLWDDFIRYDLGIADYDALSPEHKELCRLIFDIERSAESPVRCMRARAILKGLPVAERPSENFRMNIMPYLTSAAFFEDYIDLDYPDIYYMQDSDHNVSTTREYWLDDEGSEIIRYGRDIKYIIRMSKEEYPAYVEKHPEIENSYYMYYGDEYYNYEKKFERIYKTTKGFEDSLYYKYYEHNDGTIDLEYIGLPIGENQPYNADVLEIPTEIDGKKVIKFEGTISNINIGKLIIPEEIKSVSIQMSMSNTIREIEVQGEDTQVKGLNVYGLKKAVVNSKYIPEYAFCYCHELESVELNNAVEIGALAFGKDYELKDVKFSDNLKLVGRKAFAAEAESNITYPDSVEIFGVLESPYGSYVTSGNGYYSPAFDPLVLLYQSRAESGYFEEDDISWSYNSENKELTLSGNGKILCSPYGYELVAYLNFADVDSIVVGRDIDINPAVTEYGWGNFVFQPNFSYFISAYCQKGQPTVKIYEGSKAHEQYLETVEYLEEDMINTMAYFQPAVIIKSVGIGQKNESGGVIGDADGDGKISLSDAVGIMSYVTNPEKYEISEETASLADIHNTGDGLTNMDALELQKFLAGMTN